jgi:hypothetical protein
MLVFIHSWADNIATLHIKLCLLGIHGEIMPGETPDRASKIFVRLTAKQIIDLREHFDVMVLERGDHTVIYLDEKGKRFSVR